MRPSYLETNIFPLSNGTAIAFWLDLLATAPLIVNGFSFWSLWADGPINWLEPSTKHEGYYCLPPGIWIGDSMVLNERLDGSVKFWRNRHLKGFLLGTIPRYFPPMPARNSKLWSALKICGDIIMFYQSP